jgi:hypothetical protein
MVDCCKNANTKEHLLQTWPCLSSKPSGVKRPKGLCKQAKLKSKLESLNDRIKALELNYKTNQRGKKLLCLAEAVLILMLTTGPEVLLVLGGKARTRLITSILSRITKLRTISNQASLTTSGSKF